MLKISCSLCGFQQARLITKENEWDIIECIGCSFVFIVPVPDEQYLYLHYQKYLPFDKVGIVQWRTLMLDVFRKSLDAIEARCRCQRGVLLDIGCGWGFFLEMARQNGWRVYGLEPCVHARAYAATKALEVDGCSLFDRAYKDEMFDVVTLFYVLEHLPRPLSYLKEINRILKPGGLLLVRVPHTTPLVKILKIFNIPNKLYDAPSHLSDFSPRTIAMALDKTGFGEIHTFPGGATRPHAFGQRIISRSSGFLADILYAISGRRLLLPGVSKTTIATKMRHGDA